VIGAVLGGVRHPIATIPLLVLVGLSYSSIGEANQQSRSGIKSLLGDSRFRHWRGEGLPPCIIREGEGELEAIELDSTSPITPALATVYYRDGPVERHGPWDYWYQFGGPYVEVEIHDPSRISAVEAATAAYQHWLSRIDYGNSYSEQQVREINAYRLEDWKRRWGIGGPPKGRILWRGVAHNAGVAVVLAAFGVNLAAWPRRVGEFRARRASARLGRCPCCRYPTRGLRGSVCPECGAPIVGG
jgi:hypothetical protein